MQTTAVPMSRNRDFVLLWSGQLVSTLGSQVSLVAFPLLVLALTGSPAKAGIVGFANTIPVLLLYLPVAVFPAPAWNAVVVGARLTLTSDRLRGRVNSVARLLSGSMVPLGALSGGLLAATVGTTSTFLIFAAWQALVAAAALSARSLRHAVA
jgi:hypothetical protein